MANADGPPHHSDHFKSGTVVMSLPPTPMQKKDGTKGSVDIVLVNAEGTSFEEIMKERNRVRKEREQYNIAELKVQIGILQDALSAETKRRVDATIKLDDQAREQVYEMEQRLRKQLKEDNAKLEDRMSKLEQRLDDLEQRWAADATQQMESIAQKGRDFGRALDQLQQEQDTERKARLRREGALLQQVENHAREFEDRWNDERKDRILKIKKLEESLNEKERKRKEDQTNFLKKVEDELEALKSEFASEVSERQAQDEEIVSALNRYTQQLQHSLSILSSD